MGTTGKSYLGRGCLSCGRQRICAAGHTFEPAVIIVAHDAGCFGNIGLFGNLCPLAWAMLQQIGRTNFGALSVVGQNVLGLRTTHIRVANSAIKIGFQPLGSFCVYATFKWFWCGIFFTEPSEKSTAKTPSSKRRHNPKLPLNARHPDRPDHLGTAT